MIRRNYINNYSFEYGSLTGLAILFHGPFFLFCYLCVQGAGEKGLGFFYLFEQKPCFVGDICTFTTQDTCSWGMSEVDFCLLIDIKIALAKPSSSLHELPAPTRPLSH